MSDDKPRTWTIRAVLDWTRARFEKASIDSARLTAELLLAHTLKTERVKLYMDLDRPLSADELTQYRGLIQRRLTFEPTQYLTGQQAFYGRRFAVDPRVLIPRPETELLVEAALTHLPKDAPARALDLCTGSGCVAVSIAAERPLTQVWATELSPDALAVARANAESLGVSSRVHFGLGDLFAPLEGDLRFDVVASNPPYIRTQELGSLQHEVQREPRAALDGGEDGLGLLRRICQGAPRFLRPGGHLALEIGDDQGEAMQTLLTTSGYHAVRIEKDLARLDRLALAQLPPSAE